MAKEEEDSNRTHEPDLRELTAELDGLKDLMLQYCKSHAELELERDKRYETRFISSEKAVDAALTAAKEQTSSSFAASEKAIIKAEDAQREYNTRSNEFRGQLDDQAKRLASKDEMSSLRVNVEEKIDRIDRDVRTLREYRSEYTGKEVATKDTKQDSRTSIVVIVSIFGGLVGLIGLAILVMNLMHLLKG